jgi:hypothetical protein
MAIRNKTLRIAILDDELEDGLIYWYAYRNFIDLGQPKKENARVFNTVIPFLESARTADFIFADFGMLDDFVHGNLRDVYSLVSKFAEEHPRKIVTFILTMPWNYYKDYDIFELPNVEHIDISEGNWRIADRIVRWLFDNAVHDLFTKDWGNLQEQLDYIPRLKKTDAVRIVRNLYGDPSMSDRGNMNWYRKLIEDWYQDKWNQRHGRKDGRIAID